ncbi:MAG: phage major capsid protein [Eggerthellaceae bacterium]|nr:phage major capsid protein [Eggerthellaceae bacterium]
MAIDISTKTQGVVLPREVSDEIWAKTADGSAVLQLANQINIPGAGLTVQTIDGEPTANWVNETDEKPVSKPAVGSKEIQAYTMAVIIPFSNQFFRDKTRLYEEMVARAPRALGTKLDRTVFGSDAAPGPNFDTFADVTSVALGNDAWAGIVAADSTISANDGILNGWALNPQGKSALLTARDNNGRPLFISSTNTDNGIGDILGQPTFVTRSIPSGEGTPQLLGVAGDWEEKTSHENLVAADSRV